MAEISAKMVMGLREKTGAAMMLCKEALIATDANEEDAIVYIRTKLGKKFAGATERSASDGVIAIAAVGNTVARRAPAVVAQSIRARAGTADRVCGGELFRAVAKHSGNDCRRGRHAAGD